MKTYHFIIISLHITLYLCFWGYLCQLYVRSGDTIIMFCASLLDSTPSNIMWEIDHSGSMYTKEITKCYKPGPLISEKPGVKHLPAHNWKSPSLFLRQITNNWKQYKVIHMVLNSTTHLQMATTLFWFLPFFKDTY